MAPPIAPSATGAAELLLTYRGADAVLANMVIQEQLEKRREVKQLQLFQPFSPRGQDGEGGRLNYQLHRAPPHQGRMGPRGPSAPLAPRPAVCPPAEIAGRGAAAIYGLARPAQTVIRPGRDVAPPLAVPVSEGRRRRGRAWVTAN